MLSPTGGGGTSITRANTNTNLAKTKVEEEAKKQAESLVKDVNSAIDFLIDSNLKSEDDVMFFNLLSAITMQLSQQPRSAKSALDAFKALAYIILDLHQKHIVADITDTIAKAVSSATKRTCNELVEATEQLVLVVAKNNEASVQLKMDCQETIINFEQVLKEVAMKMTEEKTSTNGG